MTIYAGFDPGIGMPGLGCIRRDGSKLVVVQGLTIRTSPKSSLDERLQQIWSAASLLIRTHHPVVMGIERQSGVQIGKRRDEEGRGFNAKSHLAHETVGLIKGCCYAYGVPWLEIEPKAIKIAVLGPRHGNADKRLVQERIQAMTGFTGSNNATDALATAIGSEQRWRIRRVA